MFDTSTRRPARMNIFSIPTRFSVTLRNKKTGYEKAYLGKMKIIGENVFQYMFYTQKTTINTETGAEEPIPNVYEVVCATWNRVKYQAPQASYHIVDVKERRDNHVRWIEDGKKSGIIFLIDQYDKWYAKKAAEACAFDFDVDEALEAEANEAKANTSAFEEVNDEEVEAII